jgi:predicted nucleic-acid-binding Zn-ribbon protein
MQPFVIKPCPECGGQRVQVENYSSAIFLQQRARSTSVFKQKSNISATVVLVCIHCGYTAWYAKKFSNLIPD